MVDKEGYTKGEWALIEDEDSFQIYVPTKFTVAKIHKRWGDDGKANAHLIAQAPRLYEALKEVKLVWQGLDPHINFPHLQEVIEQALAKVDGK